MKLIAISVLVLSLFITPSPAGAATNEVTGDWRGTLDTGVAKLRLVFHISKASTGGLTGTLDSVDQGARGIPVESVSISNGTFRLEVKSVKGVYEGTVDTSGSKATGNWSQGAVVLPLTLEKGLGKDSNADAENLSPADEAASKLAAQKLAGVWNGSLAVGPTSLRLRISISKTPAGTAAGTMDSLDQGANGIPLSAITLKEGKLHFEARGIGGVYEGALETSGLELTGEWQQGGRTLPLDLRHATAK